MRSKYDKVIQNLREHLEEAKRERVQYRESFNSFSKVISDNIYGSVKSVIKAMPSFGTSTCLDENLLHQILALKVDKTDFDKIYEEKANKV